MRGAANESSSTSHTLTIYISICMNIYKGGRGANMVTHANQNQKARTYTSKQNTQCEYNCDHMFILI